MNVPPVSPEKAFAAGKAALLPLIDSNGHLVQESAAITRFKMVASFTCGVVGGLCVASERVMAITTLLWHIRL